MASPVRVRDDRGVVISLQAPPQRIVSLLPSLTESVCALGACNRVVGADRYSNWPAAVRNVPKVGGLDDAQIERIVALKPDVVLAARSTRVIDRLEGLGLTVVVFDSQTHEDVKNSLTRLADLLDRPQAAVQLWQGIERDMARAQQMVPSVWRGKAVYFEVSSAPYAAGEASFIGQTLARMGLGNVVPASMGPFPKLNPEFVVRGQPALIMASARALSEMPQRPGWSTLQALQLQRQCGFDVERYELLVRPGPRLGEAALVLAQCLVNLEPRP